VNLVHSDGTVLLSPGSALFDIFRGIENYEVRGGRAVNLPILTLINSWEFCNCSANFLWYQSLNRSVNLS